MSKTARWIMYPMLGVVVAFFLWVQFVYGPQKAEELEQMKAEVQAGQVEQAETADVEVQVQTNDSK